MQSENPFLDQLAKLMTNAAGAAKGVRDEVATMIKTQAERLVNDLDLVPREEFEAMKTIALNARKDVEQLRARLAKLELQNDSRDDSRTIKASRNSPRRKSSPKRSYRR
jgi:BMFP domain-containing protein YqiC